MRTASEDEKQLIRLMVRAMKLARQREKERSYYLSFDRIEKFRHFTANESNVGEKCAICLSDFEVGNHLVELNCDKKHLLCKVCTYKWFSENNTCPICRHLFSNLYNDPLFF